MLQWTTHKIYSIKISLLIIIITQTPANSDGEDSDDEEFADTSMIYSMTTISLILMVRIC